MWLTIEVILLAALVIVLHVTALAGGARLGRIPIREICYGTGWHVARYGVIRLRALPFGGYVRMKDSRSEDLPAEQCHDAFDHQPGWLQAAIPLGACATTLGVGILILGAPGWDAFVAGFSQILLGALAPLSTAQALLGSFFSFIEARGFVASFGLLCTKTAAFNLLPLPALNGGDALLALTNVQKWSPRTEERLKQISLTLLLVVLGCWLTALGAYVWNTAA